MLYNKKMQEYIAENRHAVVGYITAGYPGKETFFEIIKNCAEKGLAILEIGFPSENPYEDGEVIREAHKVVDKESVSNLTFWRKLRNTISNPIWLMGYYKDLCASEFYLKLADENLIDALVIPDAKIENAVKIKRQLNARGVDVVGFLSDRMDKETIDYILDEFGLIYQQLYSGVTGMPIESDSYKQLLQYSLEKGNHVMFAGFGISSGERVKELLKNGFYGAIIGTAIMKALNASEEELYQFIEELAKAAEGGKKSADSNV